MASGGGIGVDGIGDTAGRIRVASSRMRLLLLLLLLLMVKMVLVERACHGGCQRCQR